MAQKEGGLHCNRTIINQRYLQKVETIIVLLNIINISISELSELKTGLLPDQINRSNKVVKP